MEGILVYPLIEGFMANGLLGMLDTESAGNEFRRPPKAKTFFDIAPDKVALEPWPSVGLMLALLRPLLGFVRQVIAGIDGRCVSFELP